MLRTHLLPLLLLASPLAAQTDAPTWGPAPPGLPKGAEIIIDSGNPEAAEPFTLRARMPAGYTVAPHYHPTDEVLTVISGSMVIGMGDNLDPAQGKLLKAGDTMSMGAKEVHFVVVKEDAVLRVQSTGPFEITYVRETDDPRKQMSSP